jgi:EmrB/QacA subfamily drug resistance transporter
VTRRSRCTTLQRMNRQVHGAPATTFVITALAVFMFALDRLVVTTALPAIARDLHASLEALEWTVNAYTLSFAVLLLTGAAVGERFGRRRTYVAGLVLFTAGSALCALAPSTGVLVAARAIQGVGGAVIMPLSLTILVAETPVAQRGAVLGAWGATAAIAASTGPVVGGALTSALSWHWIFWVNVPVGLVLAPLAHRHLNESAPTHPRLDLAGVALSAIGVFGVVWSLIHANAGGWLSAAVLIPLGIGIVGLFAFLVAERRVASPMLPLSLFASRTFSAASAIAFLAYLALFGALFLVAQLLQIGLSTPSVQAGVELLVMTAPMIVAAPIAGRACDRLGARPLLLVALALVASAFAYMAAIAAPGLTFLDLVPGLATIGIGAACLVSPLQVILLAAVAPEHHGQVSAVSTVTRELGGIFGVAVLAGVFAANGGTGSAHAFLAGARPAFAIAAAAAVAALLVALAIRRPTGTPAQPHVPAHRPLQPLPTTD